MDILSLTSSVISGGLGALGVFKLTFGAAKDRWMAEVNYRYDSEIEQLKATLQRQQKNAEAVLENVVYIGKAQYDLEVEAYKTLWPCVSVVRLRARMILMPDIFVLPQDENALNQRLRLEGIKQFHEAHNLLVEETERLAPFYPQHIKQAARLVTDANNELTMTFTDSTLAIRPAEHNKVIQSAMDEVANRVAATESVIRQRLSELRVVS
jgi:hypothetical protein